jgi:hypothetical protein
MWGEMRTGLDECCLPADELEAGPIRELLTNSNLYGAYAFRHSEVKGIGGWGMGDCRTQVFKCHVVSTHCET